MAALRYTCETLTHCSAFTRELARASRQALSSHVPKIFPLVKVLCVEGFTMRPVKRKGDGGDPPAKKRARVAGAVVELDAATRKLIIAQLQH